MRVFHVLGDRVDEFEASPENLPEGGYLWLASGRREFEVGVADVQAALQRWTGSTLFELHVADLLNNQLPSNFESTSAYDLLVFRRLAAGAGSERLFADDGSASPASAHAALDAIDTSPVGFAIFDNIMRSLTVLTAIFLPLNLVTGFLGMNFEGLPLIHSARGFWIIFTVMLFIDIGMSWFFWRKRYLGRS